MCTHSNINTTVSSAAGVELHEVYIVVYRVIVNSMLFVCMLLL